MKKKDRAKELIKKKDSLFKCPVCNGAMLMNDTNSLTCNFRHSFDLSKKGYLNLLTSAISPVYSKELFEARHKLCKSGLYNPLVDELAKIITRYKNESIKKEINILDAGCGEGTHIYDIYKRISEDLNYSFIGVDISKDSINIAANNMADIIWCVADLAKLPFKNRSFDFILNILSPANYGEFQRVLTDEGIVIKVVPGSQYLIELRELFYSRLKAAKYSNSKVINYFSKKLKLEDILNINYSFTVDKEFLPYLVEMTPLTWGQNTKKQELVFEKDVMNITVDLAIIIGKKKEC